MRRLLWSIKPPCGVTLNQGHPLSRGLVFCSPFNEQGGNPRDLVTGVVATKADNPVWAPQGIYFDGSNDNASFAVPDANFLGAITIMVWCNITSNASYRCILTKASFISGATGARKNPFDLYSNANGVVSFMRSGGTSASNNYGLVYTAIGIVQVGKMTQYCAVCPGGLVTDMQYGAIYVNGVSKSVTYTQNASSGNFTGNDAPITFIRPDNGTLAAGTYSHAMIWNRALAATEVQQMYVNPWQIFQPRLAVWGYVISSGSLYFPANRLYGAGFNHNSLGRL